MFSFFIRLLVRCWLLSIAKIILYKHSEIDKCLHIYTNIYFFLQTLLYVVILVGWISQRILALDPNSCRCSTKNISQYSSVVSKIVGESKVALCQLKACLFIECSDCLWKLDG